MLAAAAVAIVSASSALAVPVLVQENYDADPVGPLPPGWVQFSGEVTPSGVSSEQSVSTPNSFEIDHDGNDVSGFTLNAFTLRRSFTPYTLNAASETLLLEFDIRADVFGDGSEGFVIQIWNGNSGIQGAAPRLFRGSPAQFYFQDTATVGPQNQDQWYRFRMELDASSATDGQTRWYLDNTLVATIPWNNAVGPGQLNNIQHVDIRGVQTGAGTGSRIYIDNLLVAVPEPASLALLGLGTAMLMRRRAASR
jgi:hypothetical protein